jgi:hypothetical protein
VLSSRDAAVARPDMPESRSGATLVPGE